MTWIRDFALYALVAMAGAFALATGAYLIGRMFTSGKLMALRRWKEKKNGQAKRSPNGGPHFPRKNRY